MGRQQAGPERAGAQRAGWLQADEEAVRRLVEWIVQRIDPATRVLLREPGRPSIPDTLRLALLRSGHAVPLDLTAGEWRLAQSAVGRERIARRVGAALGLQPPDQLTGVAG